jgi:hypothetical protein
VSSVVEGNKSIKITATPQPADLVVALLCRQYRRFRNVNNQNYSEGIAFYAMRESRWIVNYPNLHYDNGVQKNSATSGLYKPTVRLFKNARSYLVQQRAIAVSLAPSYFLECLIYNVPDNLFVSNAQQAYRNIVEWLRTADLEQMMCQNGQQPLFGNTPEQWSLTSARTLVIGLVNLWDHWGT